MCLLMNLPPGVHKMGELQTSTIRETNLREGRRRGSMCGSIRDKQKVPM